MFKLALPWGSMFLHVEVWFAILTKFQSMTVDGKHVFAACQHSIFQSIFQHSSNFFKHVNHVTKSWLNLSCERFREIFISINSMKRKMLFGIIWLLIHARVSLFDHTVCPSNNNVWVILFQSMTVESSMRESVWFWQFLQQLKHAV